MATENLSNCIIRAPYDKRLEHHTPYDITPESDNFEPLDIEQATAYVFEQKPPEVAVFEGYRDIQMDVAKTIAEVIFRPGVPIGENLTRLQRNEPLLEPVVPEASFETLSERIERTDYRAVMTPLG